MRIQSIHRQSPPAPYLALPSLGTASLRCILPPSHIIQRHPPQPMPTRLHQPNRLNAQKTKKQPQSPQRRIQPATARPTQQLAQMRR